MNVGIVGFGAKEATSINTAYLAYMQAAGLNPVIITKENNLPAMVDMCEGLLLPGGVDLEPTFYGENNIASSACSPERDNFERHLLGLFIGNNKKVFGICRGFQLIVREFLRLFENNIKDLNHDFFQHINEHNLVNSRGVARNIPTHHIKANMKALYLLDSPEKNIFVNSIHHQGLVCTGNPHILVDDNNYLKALAITDFSAPKVGTKTSIIIEAVDVKINGTLLRGVQWHPEELMDVNLLKVFFLNKHNDIHKFNGNGA